MPVVAGTGSNSTDMAIKYTKMAEEEGADGSLQVAPYYNKPTQEGLYRHFAAVAESTDLPILLYNIPGRTAVTISAETIARLAEIPEHRRGQGIYALDEHGQRHHEPVRRGVRRALGG